MLIDFNKLNGNDSMNTVLDPREIFDILPEKHEKYEEYLRDVQSEVLTKWFNSDRDKKDVIVKMNTGSGKTVVGLLMLKSCLNEKQGPAVYVVPDNYLLQQVMQEASDLGIDVTDNPYDINFKKGESILVINIFKLINGKTIFGVEHTEIDIGSIIIDDAHACLDIAEDQFTIEIPSSTRLYSELFELFKESIKQQSELGLLELEHGDFNANRLIPFWSWIDKKSEVLRILHSYKDDKSQELKSLIFSWPLLKNNIELCNCVFGSDFIEISPKYLPIHLIPSFQYARRRIFMSATIADDSILVSHLDVDPESITEAITPSSSNDIGERMIIIPQEINPDIEDLDLKKFYKHLSKTRNVVVIVPSYYRASFWSDIATKTLNVNNLYEGVNELKEKHVGLVVIVNKYDGIDLPKNACEVLVIDGLPDVRRKIDKIEQAVLRGNDDSLTNTIQRIEQGMGRGIRSKDDHCVVFLMGRTLIDHLYVSNAKSKFTTATKVQMDLSSELTKQIRGKGLKELYEVIKYCLNRNKEWITTSRGALVKVKYNSKVTFVEKIILERSAYNKATNKLYVDASNLLLEATNKEDDLIAKGYLKQKLAEYIHFYDPVEAQQTLMSATNDNSQVVHPVDGIQYAKLLPPDLSQAKELVAYLHSKYDNPNKYVIAVNSLIEKLTFLPGTSNSFEQAIMDLAFHLGFRGQRPEKEFNNDGPDGLWSLGNSNYFVIECKNGATVEKISKRDCNQLNGAINWFTTKYDSFNTLVPIMIHKSNVFEYTSPPHKDIRLITETQLDMIKVNFKNLSKGIADNYNNTNKVNDLLESFDFKFDNFVKKYTTNFKKAK